MRMGWLETISSILGAGAGGVLAVAIYSGAVAIESEMRPEAKTQISALIRRTNFRPSLDILVDVVRHIFEIVFGDKHFTIKCLCRSFLASYLFWTILAIVFMMKYTSYMVNSFGGMITSIFDLLVFLIIITLLSCIPDYISLYKGRIILRKMSRKPYVLNISILLVIDLSVSLFIAYASFVSIVFWAAGKNSLYEVFDAMLDGLKILAGRAPKREDDILVAIFNLTTLMTSLWTILIMIAAMVAKAVTGLTYIMRFVNWMFDVDAHPVRVLGLVAGGITWTGSLVVNLV
jgi:hypothetical protein